jgi:tetrachlorobenzoquinone reductase
MTRPPLLQLRVTAIRYIARHTHSFELALPEGGPLPDAPAGAHIGLQLHNGLMRQYSLVHGGERPERYEVGVKLDANGGGGSRFMHESVRVGMLLPVEAPRNNFPLAEHAAHSIFFAGGIGITPIVAMLERLATLGRSRTLFYACRNRDELAFLPELARSCAPELHIDAEHEGRVLDIAAKVAAAPRDAHLYCCGPAPMLAAFEAATSNWPREQVHIEYFTAREPAALSGGFVVALGRSGREFRIPPGRSILHVLREGGVEVASSCEEGVCAACETAVLEGVPDHRDSILSASEQAGNRTMMICCSGSKTPRLVLDL